MGKARLAWQFVGSGCGSDNACEYENLRSLAASFPRISAHIRGARRFVGGLGDRRPLPIKHDDVYLLLTRHSVTKILFLAGTCHFFSGLVPVFGAQSLIHRIDQPESAFSNQAEASLPVIQGAVWSVTSTADGSILVGSNALAVFDGEQWTRLSVPESAYAFRALARGRGDRVWVGGINALGYASRGATGDWRFTSLMPDLQRVDSNPLGDVWTVHTVGQSALWVTSDRIVRWTPRAAGDHSAPADGSAGKFEVWTRRAKLRLIAFPDSAGLWIFQEGEGLLHIGAEGPPNLMCPANALPEQPVTWMAAARHPESAALVGLGNRAYAWNGGRVFRRLEGLSAALDGKVPTTAVWLDDRSLAVGTFKAGVLLANVSTAPFSFSTGDAESLATITATISSANGLDDDKVNALWGDEARLWVGSTDGLVRIDGAGRAAWFEQKTDLAKGAAQSVVEHLGATYIATNKHLFRIDPDGTLLPVAGAQPELMAAASIDTELWTTGFGGVWRGGPTGREQCYHTTGDVPCVAASRRFPGGALILDGYELKALKPSATGIAIHDLGARMSDTPVALHEDANGDVWVSTLVDGIRRFSWRDSANGRLQLRLKANYRPHFGLPPDAKGARLKPVGPRLFAFTETEILGFDVAAQVFQTVPELQAFRGIDAVAVSTAGNSGQPTSNAETESMSYWVARLKAAEGLAPNVVFRVHSRATGPLRVEPLQVPGLERVGAVTRVDRTADAAEPTLWFSGSRGLLKVVESALRPAPHVTALQNVAFSNANSPRREFGADAVALPADVRRVVFDYRVPTAASGATVFYQTWLESIDDTWTRPTRAAERTLENLAPGRYTFRVRTIDPFGQTSPAQTRRFVVLAPWWRTAPAFAGYAVIVLGIGIGIARWRSRNLRGQNERLNRLVAERTREIELASTAKSEFLENVSHEIRNPLNGLSGLLDLMKEERFDPRERELARSLRAVAGELQRVFEEVLSFSKLEYGYAKLRKRPFRLRASLGEIVELFAPVARQQGCTLQLEWSAHGDDAFDGDESKVKTVISNFVSNALKYAPGGPITIRVDANPCETGAVELYIEVRDSGPGVPAEEQELIFKKFVRGSNVARDGASGTGLGLATCRVLAQIMHGNVGIESPLSPRLGMTPARGSLFYLRLLLPRARVDESPLDLSPNRIASASTEVRPMAATSLRALIVEDEPYNQIVLEGIALELGYRTDLADSASAAWKKLESCGYAIVFLDWELPGSNGGEIARRLRALPGGSAPLILAVTAHDSDEIRAQCFEAGMDGFLLKPYDVATVRTLLNQAQANRDGTARSPDFAPPKRSWVPGPEGTLEPLNLRAFAQYRRARPASSHSAPELFAQAMESELQAIDTALTQADHNALADGAHRLRALAGLINARSLLDAARALEISARQKTKGELGPAVATAAKAGRDIVERVRLIERA